MAVVPRNNVIPLGGPQPSQDSLLMAAAVMHEMGRFEKIPLADQLKGTEKGMEQQQRLMDSLKIEDLPRKPTKEAGA